MTAATVATAASANPPRSTLVTAVKKADLVTAFNTAPALTVFAPDNAAFAKVPATTLSKVLADKTELTKVLTCHVVKGRVSPAELASGKTLTTLEGGTLKTARMGSTYEVNSADVVCGNVQTANTTVQGDAGSRRGSGGTGGDRASRRCGGTGGGRGRGRSIGRGAIGSGRRCPALSGSGIAGGGGGRPGVLPGRAVGAASSAISASHEADATNRAWRPGARTCLLPIGSGARNPGGHGEPAPELPQT